jgi:hypothetical protein
MKSEIYDLIINKLIAAGWTNVSSKASTDYAVLTSVGNTGDKSLIINLRDIPAAGTAANTVKTSAYCQMSYRLQSSYAPGAVDVAGVFGRPALAWTDLYIAPVAASGQVPADTVVNYKVYADLSKIILAIEYPNPTGYSPILIYIGQPDTLLSLDSENRGMLVGATNSATTASSVMVCNTSDGMGSVAAPYALKTYAFLPDGDPNNSNKRMVSSIYYGNALEGYRGKLDGVKCVLNTKLFTGDTITIGAETYYVLTCHTQGITSFPSQALLVRTA